MSGLRILHRTEGFLAVDKPAGIASIPEHAGDEACLQCRLAAELGSRVFIVHRLDKEVSGVILFALNAGEHRRLCLAFERRLVGKTYIAGTHGVVAGESGEIDLPLREFGSGRIGVDAQNGKPCLTRWRVLERRATRTLLAMEPHTGRRHQLRAHAYAIGHPLIGDTRYGERAAQILFPRLLLHATRLEIPDPAGERIVIECPAPEDFLKIWNT